MVEFCRLTILVSRSPGGGVTSRVAIQLKMHSLSLMEEGYKKNPNRIKNVRTSDPSSLGVDEIFRLLFGNDERVGGSAPPAPPSRPSKPPYAPTPCIDRHR